MRRSMIWTLAALAAALALAMVACGGGDGEETETVMSPDEPTAEGAPATASDLAGIWLIDEGIEDSLLFQFNPDGSFAADWVGLLAATPALAGTYEVDEGTVTMIASGESDFCARGDRWAWDAGIPEEGRLDVVWTASRSRECDPGVGTRYTFIRVSPRSAPGAELTGKRGAEGRPPENAATLAGVWLLEGSGELLHFGADGAYELDDAGALGVDPEDAGTFELDRRGSLTFTSGPSSRSCTKGDRWVWEGVEIAVAPAQRPDPEAGEGGLATGGDWTLTLDVAEDACDHSIGANAVWLRIGW